MEAQKYKIYVNGVPVFLLSTAEAQTYPPQPDKLSHFAAYTGKKKLLLQYLDLLDKNKQVRSVTLHAPDVESLWRDFQSCFSWIEAAGGYVTNPKGELLVFFRRGSWDLPKGKIDPGESPEQAALREVEEETGLKQLTLGPLLGHTYHTYTQGGKRMLKKTWWYRLQSADSTTVPQYEEDIEEIQWVTPASWLTTAHPLYGSIRDVIEWAN